MIRDEFQVHLMNEAGINKAKALAECFSRTLDEIERVVGTGGTREMAIVRTKLQEASFFAKRAVANDPVNTKE